MNEAPAPNALLRAASDLFPGYFALVMATGIISIACFLLGMKAISLILLVIAIVAYLVLWFLLLLRLLFCFSRVKADIRRHVYKKFPLKYDPQYWGMVFPFGV